MIRSNSSGLNTFVSVKAKSKFEAECISILSPETYKYTILRPSTRPLSESMFSLVDNPFKQKIKFGTSEMKAPPSCSAISASDKHSTNLFFQVSVKDRSKNDCNVVNEITVDN